MIGRPNRVAIIHSCRRWPAGPKGASNVSPSPVPNPSSETEKLWTRTWDMRASGAVGCLQRATGVANLGRSNGRLQALGEQPMDTAPRSGCPINAAVEVLGDPWATLVLRDIMFGDRRHFRELIAGSEEGIAT